MVLDDRYPAPRRVHLRMIPSRETAGCSTAPGQHSQWARDGKGRGISWVVDREACEVVRIDVNSPDFSMFMAHPADAIPELDNHEQAAARVTPGGLRLTWSGQLPIRTVGENCWGIPSLFVLPTSSAAPRVVSEIRTLARFDYIPG